MKERCPEMARVTSHRDGWTARAGKSQLVCGVMDAAEDGGGGGERRDLIVAANDIG